MENLRNKLKKYLPKMDDEKAKSLENIIDKELNHEDLNKAEYFINKFNIDNVSIEIIELNRKDNSFHISIKTGANFDYSTKRKK